MDEETLAQLYGMVPSPDESPVPSIYDGTSPVSSPEDEYEQDVGNVPATSLPVSQAVGQSSGNSVSVGQSGINFNSLNTLEKRDAQPKGLEGKIAASKANIQSQVDQYKPGYEAVGEGHKQSALDKVEVQSRYDEIERDTANSLAELRKNEAVEEGNIRAKLEQDHNVHMADTRALNEEIRATTINPGKLFADMTGGEKAGMLVTAFVHDYLGTKGMKTSSMDTYNKAIERSVDAQLANLGTKKAAMSGMQQMWEMQRAHSKSDEEARVRIHGLALQSLKDTAVGKMAMFDSDFARASIPAAIADIDKAILDNNVRLDNMSREWHNQEANLLTTQNRDRVNAAQGAAQIAIAQRRQALEEAKFGAEAGASSGPLTKEVMANLVVDPSKGQVFGKNRMWLTRDPKVVEKLQEKVNAGSRVIELSNEYAALAKTLGKRYQGPLNKYIDNDADVAKMFQLNDELINALVSKNAATTFTDAYLKRIQTMLPKNSYLTANKASEMAGQFALMTKQDIDTQLRGFTSEAGDDIKSAYFPSTRDENSVSGEGGVVPDSTFASEQAQVAVDWKDNLKAKEYKADKLAGQINDDNKFEVPADYLPKIEQLYKIARSNGEDEDQKIRAREILNNYAYDPSLEVGAEYGMNDTFFARNQDISNVAKYYINELGKGDKEAETQRQAPIVKRQAEEFGRNLDMGKGVSRSPDYVADTANSLYGE